MALTDTKPLSFLKEIQFLVATTAHGYPSRKVTASYSITDKDGETHQMGFEVHPEAAPSGHGGAQ